MTTPASPASDRVIGGERPDRPVERGPEGAWKKEMERAQADAWFAHRVPGRSPASAPPSPRATAATDASERYPDRRTTEPEHPDGRIGRPTRDTFADHHPTRAIPDGVCEAAHPPPPSACGLGTPRPAPGARRDDGKPDGPDTLPAAAPPTWTWAAATTTGPGAAPTGTRLSGQTETRVAPAPERLAPREQRAPIRMHVERRDDVATVWIGIDAAAWSSVAVIARSTTAWLAASGVRSVRWVCNGREVRHGDGGLAFTPPTCGAMRPSAGIPFPLSTEHTQ